MFKIYILLFIDIIFAVAGQVLLKHGMNKIGDLEFNLANIPVLFSLAIKNLYIWLAFVFYGVGFVLWLFILSKVRLSIAYPATALIYVLVVAASWFILKEKITANQIFGIAIIIVGLFFLFKDSIALSN